MLELLITRQGGTSSSSRVILIRFLGEQRLASQRDGLFQVLISFLILTTQWNSSCRGGIHNGAIGGRDPPVYTHELAR